MFIQHEMEENESYFQFRKNNSPVRKESFHLVKANPTSSIVVSSLNNQILFKMRT